MLLSTFETSFLRKVGFSGMFKSLDVANTKLNSEVERIRCAYLV